MVRCEYMCGDVKVTLKDVPGTSADDCEHPDALRRAARQAAQKRAEDAAKKRREGP